MIRFTGFIVIILGTTLIGFKQAEKIKERYNLIIYLKKVLIMLRGEIDYNESEISEIFMELRLKTRGSFKKFFAMLVESTKGKYDKPISFYWREAVQACLTDLNFTDEDLERITDLGENLGYLDKNMQLKNIDYLMDYVNRTKEELDESMDKNIKMCKMFGILAGIFITIVLC